MTPAKPARVPAAPRPRRVSLPLAGLVEDTSIYPRHAVDGVYVNQLAEALRAGAVLPPPVAEEGTQRLVDGWHRLRASRKVLGAEGVVDVLLKHYDSEQELVLDAIALNATHGRKLDRIDRVRSVLLAEQAGAPVERIALALNISPERVQKLTVRVAYAPAAGLVGQVVEALDTATAPKAGEVAAPATVRVILKRPLQHLSGTILSADQAEAALGQAGTSHLLQVRQLLAALRFDLINPTDARLRRALVELQEEIGHYLERVPAPEEPEVQEAVAPP